MQSVRFMASSVYSDATISQYDYPRFPFGRKCCSIFQLEPFEIDYLRMFFFYHFAHAQSTPVAGSARAQHICIFS